MRIIYSLLLLLLASLSSYAEGEKALTRGCNMVRLKGTYLPTDGKEKQKLSIDCIWGTPKMTGGENAILISSSQGQNPGSFKMLPPMEYFRKDKNVTRQDNFQTGVAVMLGDQNRRYIRFCSYLINLESSAAYLEFGKVVSVDGKQKMQREGVFIVDTADFYNVTGAEPRAVVSNFNPANSFYTNALWSFFERMYNAYIPKK